MELEGWTQDDDEEPEELIFSLQASKDNSPVSIKPDKKENFKKVLREEPKSPKKTTIPDDPKPKEQQPSSPKIAKEKDNSPQTLKNEPLKKKTLKIENISKAMDRVETPTGQLRHTERLPGPGRGGQKSHRLMKATLTVGKEMSLTSSSSNSVKKTVRVQNNKKKSETMQPVAQLEGAVSGQKQSRLKTGNTCRQSNVYQSPQIPQDKKVGLQNTVDMTVKSDDPLMSFNIYSSRFEELKKSNIAEVTSANNLDLFNRQSPFAVHIDAFGRNDLPQIWPNAMKSQARDEYKDYKKADFPSIALPGPKAEDGVQIQSISFSQYEKNKLRSYQKIPKGLQSSIVDINVNVEEELPPNPSAQGKLKSLLKEVPNPSTSMAFKKKLGLKKEVVSGDSSQRLNPPKDFVKIPTKSTLGVGNLPIVVNPLNVKFSKPLPTKQASQLQSKLANALGNIYVIPAEHSISQGVIKKNVVFYKQTGNSGSIEDFGDAVRFLLDSNTQSPQTNYTQSIDKV